MVRSKKHGCEDAVFTWPMPPAAPATTAPLGQHVLSNSQRSSNGTGETRRTSFDHGGDLGLDLIWEDEASVGCMVVEDKAGLEQGSTRLGKERERRDIYH